MNKAVILQRAKQVLNIEATGIVSLIDRLDDRFIQAVELLYNCRGKVVVTGLGKSGLICRKSRPPFRAWAQLLFSFTPAMPITVTWA